MKTEEIGPGFEEEPMAATRELQSRWLSLNRSDHFVQFYTDDAGLVESVAGFLAAGVSLGEANLVIATPEHRSALLRRLAQMGMDPEVLIGSRALLLLDAEETLASFMVDGWPDEDLFRRHVGDLVVRCLEERPGLRAFGEMVAILWKEGRGPAALRLEELWNSLGKGHDFALFCAYPMAGFRGSKHGIDFEHICREHRNVISSEDPARSVDGEDERQRVLAILRQKAESLEAEIAERKRAEEDTRRLAAIVEGSFDAIIGTDLQGRITSWNKGAERLFGHAEAEVRGKPIIAFIHPVNPEEEPAVLNRLRAGEFVPPFDTVRVRSDGRKLDVSVTISPIKDGEGRIVGASKSVRDISERRRYETALAEKEEQLRQAHKMEAVGRLAGGIAHDFNNLLTAINGYSEMALGLIGLGEPLREFLQEIKKSGDRAASLTQQLLAYSRKQILAPTVFDLNASVSEMDRMLRRLIGEDIEIRTELDPGLGLVKADTGQVQQIILNLVLNARDAMPQGGSLVLATGNRMVNEGGEPTFLEAAPGPYAMLSVTDTGMGMDDGVKSRIFEPFFTTKEVGKGTGLGLSSVFGILKQSGGGIEVESEPGKGSTFRILLPQAALADRESVAGSKASADESGRRKGTILLVEDEETVRRFVHRTLAAQGYTIVEARNGAEALDLAANHPSIDLLVTDVVMPRMSGGQLAEALAAMHPGLRVLFMSGYPDRSMPSVTATDMETRFLQKPFSHADLLQRVREFIDLPRRPAKS